MIQQPAWIIWTGRVISALPVLGLAFSAYMKFSGSKEMLKGTQKFGISLDTMQGIGIVEVICTVLYVIPQTAVLGAVLLTGYLGGAIATHVRINDDFSPPLIMGVMLWVGLFLRERRLWSLIPWRQKPTLPS